MIKNQINKMHDCGKEKEIIIHGNLGPENILVEVPNVGVVTNVMFTDFDKNRTLVRR